MENQNQSHSNENDIKTEKGNEQEQQQLKISEEEEIVTEINDGQVTKSDVEFIKEFLENKPKEFIEFLNNNNIPLDSYNISSIPRFIRIKPNNNNNDNNGNELISIIESEIKTKLIPLNWLPNFYKLEDSTVNISSSKSYKSGIFYGMDASSGAAILALNPKPGDNVLDICCAPGTKLCMISDLLEGNGTITGVDISESRLGTCKTILKKYKIPNARLFICDGTKFNSLAPIPSDSIPMEKVQAKKKLKLNNTTTTTTSINNFKEKEDEKEDEKEYEKDNNNNNINNNNLVEKKRKSKRASKKKTFDLEDLYFSNTFFMRYSVGGGLYDKVIVDAECSLDASIRHLLKYSKISRNLDLEKSKQLVNLQKGLIENGFKLLKPGGHLVYSTCSFSKDQNESVVQYLLNKYPETSKLIPSFTTQNDAIIIPFSPGFIENTFRFYPKNGTSGMFISKIEKIK
ncbi:hypothetical protein ACTFIR_004570 [Dictyostelium discoideum]